MAKKLMLIKRSVPPCPACNVMQAQLEGEGIPHEVIDITEQPDAVEQYGLTSVPVLTIEDDNGEHIRLTGIQPIEDIKELLEDGCE